MIYFGKDLDLIATSHFVHGHFHWLIRNVRVDATVWYQPTDHKAGYTVVISPILKNTKATCLVQNLDLPSNTAAL